MKSNKTVFILLVLVFLMALWLFGPIACENKVEEEAEAIVIPRWLTLEHRQQKVEAEVVEEEAAEMPVELPVVVEQPSPAAQQVTPEDIPKWQQPGTMEYLVKIQLDEKVHEYKLNPNKDDKKQIISIAAGIGIDLKAEYGLDLKIVETTRDIFHNMDGSSFDNGSFQ